VRAFADEVHGQCESVDAIFNVAGIATWGRPDTIDPKLAAKTLMVNGFGPWNVTSAFIKPMIEARKGGGIVTVSSLAALLTMPWHGIYDGGKAAAIEITKHTAMAYKRDGITAQAVVPGAVDTDMVNTLTVAGIDRDDPDVQRLTRIFRKIAISPEQAASKVIDSYEKPGKGLVYTKSTDRLLVMAAKLFPPVHGAIMQSGTNYFNNILARQELPRTKNSADDT
jgi:NAD(P)-dependent dehydrogenase (short-subunit alcohol dehydrogenase family)